MSQQLVQNILVPIGGFVLFLLAVVVFRPIARRIGPALAAGTTGIAIALTLDPVGVRLGFWQYTGSYETHANYPAYLGVLFALGGLTLAGWRVHRGFGVGAAIGFVLVGAFVALFWDNLLGIQDRSPGAIPLLADYGLWLFVVTAASVVMRVLGGPPRADPLRGETP